MLERLPQGVGRALRGLRTGLGELVWASPVVDGAPDIMTVESAAFGDGEPMPARFTQDGPDRLSPPLAWRGAPVQAAAVVLVVEDADGPTPVPIVHAIAWNLPVADRIEAGDLRPQEGRAERLGWNSFHRLGWLPPDPPPGHGPHRYAFQVFAVDRPLNFDRPPGRREILSALKGRVCARGRLIGAYERL
jgi:Raf kinase inhibitor-like YbhB/YbcL family protein